MHFGVLGAGIIGLNTALELQSKFPSAQITLIAEKFDEETTSHVAAGIFRPGTSFCGPSEEITRRWIVDSYDYYEKILRSEDADKAGVYQASGYLFSSKIKSLTKNHFLEQLLPIYRAATPDELTLCSGNWKYGAYFTTSVIESGRFLPWARARFQEAGGSVLCRRVETFNDFAEDIVTKSGKPFDAIFNCTGLGAKWLCDDKKVVPLRGQVIKVRAPWIKMFFYGDYDTYIIPGRDLVTLGGCRQLESYNEEVDRHDSTAIWERCTSLLPSLHKAEVVKEMVGLRPYRDSVRAEVEEIYLRRPTGTSTRLKIIHQYGHGGYGVTSAPGSAKYAVELLQENLRGKNVLEMPHYAQYATSKL